MPIEGTAIDIEELKNKTEMTYDMVLKLSDRLINRGIFTLADGNQIAIMLPRLRTILGKYEEKLPK